MKIVRITTTLGATVLATGVALGLGAATATAAPGAPAPCGTPGAPPCAAPAAPGPAQGRSIEQGRRDHQPFTFQGQSVTPRPAGNGDGWGFWFLGQWIRL